MPSILTSTKVPAIIKWYHKQEDDGMALTMDDLLELDTMRDGYYDYEVMDYFGLTYWMFIRYLKLINFLKEKDLFYGKS